MTRQDFYDDIKRQRPNLLRNLTFPEFCREAYYHPVGDYKRLKQKGYILFKKIYPYFVVDVLEGLDKHIMPSKHYLFLARYCKKPYYISQDKIIFFDEQEAFIFKMCDGNIDNVKEIS